MSGHKGRSALALLTFSAAFASAQGWPGHPPGGGDPWQWPGPNIAAGYWFDEFEGVLKTMQDTYWNGSYWPTTIQWIGAVLDTFLSASDLSFTNAIVEYDGNVPGAHTSTSQLQNEINTYFYEIEAYYGNEDTIQIFGAAYDDAQWVVLEWLEAIKFITVYDSFERSSLGADDVAEFAHRAHIFYNIVQNEFNTTLCGGGLTWNPALAVYKNAITNELFVDSSIGMYLYFPGDNNTDPYPSPDYINATNQTLPPLPPLAAHDPILLHNAIEEYAWFKTHNFSNTQGLIIDGFHVAPNQTTCNEPDTMIYSYNQGVVLSGLRQLWEATGNTEYLTDAYDLIETVINATGWNARKTAEAGQWAGLGRNGIMEDYCDAPANCSQDNLVFKGIYFHHLDLFCDPLPTTTPLIPGLTHLASSSLAAEHSRYCQSYTPWIEHNAYAALLTRNGTGIIGVWWGAPYVNKTQEPWPEYSVELPHGATDVWNDPNVLEYPPWVCQDDRGCNPNGRGKQSGNSKRMARLFESRREKRQASNAGQRTVETEGSGLGVVKAASDFTLKRFVK